MDTPLEFFGATLVQDSILVMGGVTERNYINIPKPPTKACKFYDIKNKLW